MDPINQDGGKAYTVKVIIKFLNDSEMSLKITKG
jgi:hypothetical protein